PCARMRNQASFNGKNSSLFDNAIHSHFLGKSKELVLITLNLFAILHVIGISRAFTPRHRFMNGIMIIDILNRIICEEAIFVLIQLGVRIVVGLFLTELEEGLILRSNLTTHMFQHMVVK